MIIRSDESIKWWLDDCKLVTTLDYQSYLASLTISMTAIMKTISNVSLTACMWASDSDL